MVKAPVSWLKPLWKDLFFMVVSQSTDVFSRFFPLASASKTRVLAMAWESPRRLQSCWASWTKAEGRCVVHNIQCYTILICTSIYLSIDRSIDLILLYLIVEYRIISYPIVSYLFLSYRIVSYPIYLSIYRSIYLSIYRGSHNFETELGVHKYGVWLYFCTPRWRDSARIRMPVL